MKRNYTRFKNVYCCFIIIRVTRVHYLEIQFILGELVKFLKRVA